jgi:hypothetical protein
MKVSLKNQEAKALADNLPSVKKGGSMSVPGLFLGLPEHYVQCICSEAEPDKGFWQFNVFYLSIPIADLMAEVREDHIALEVA